MKHLSKLLNILTDSRNTFYFRKPTASQVVILDIQDRTTSRYLDEMLLSGLSYNTLDTDVGQSKCVLYLSPCVMIVAILKFLHLLVIGKSNLISTKRMVRVAYYLACLHYMRPRVVLDFIQTTDIIVLARYCPSVKFFAIMNGHCSETLNFKMDGGSYIQHKYHLVRMNPKNASNVHIFCFGTKDIELFDQVGLGEELTGIRYHACGPLKAGFYLSEKLSGHLPTEEFDVCYCSQVCHDYVVSNSDGNRILMNCNDLLTEYLRRYNDTHGLSIVVAMREGVSGEKTEAEYFRTRFGDTKGFSLIPRGDYLSTYGLMSRSRVVLSLTSTTGVDAISWGKKSMYIPFYLSSIYRMSSNRYASDEDMWKWTVSGVSYEEFEKKLDALLAIPQEQYIAEVSNSARALSNYGAELPAHAYIRNMILNACEINSQ
ncbi:MAG: hypothetical protein K9J74_00155 [Sulfuritalea sp.]|nr:hypothetical protein [Sulfuritalea sp.]